MLYWDRYQTLSAVTHRQTKWKDEGKVSVAKVEWNKTTEIYTQHMPQIWKYIGNVYMKELVAIPHTAYKINMEVKI